MLEKPTEETLTKNGNCKTVSKILITEHFERGNLFYMYYCYKFMIWFSWLVHLAGSCTYSWFTRFSWLVRTAGSPSWLLHLADSLSLLGWLTLLVHLPGEKSVKESVKVWFSWLVHLADLLGWLSWFTCCRFTVASRGWFTWLMWLVHLVYLAG